MSDTIRVTTLVDVDPRSAFRIFTEEIDAWWKHGPRFRVHADRPSTLRFEGGAGGRLVEVADGAPGTAFEHGRVLVWEPPKRLVFEMSGRDLAPDEATEVEVLFEEAGRATRVTVAHRGWDRFPADHPVRHGLGGPAFENMMSIWWADLLASVQTHVKAARSREP